MASGSNSTILTSTGNNGKTNLSISWNENSTSVANNTSNVTVTATMSYNNCRWDVTNSGVLRSYWHDNHNNSDVLVAENYFNEFGYNTSSRSASGTINVTHNDDGTLSGYAYASWTQLSSYGGYAPSTGSTSTGWVALTTIARKSSPTVSPTSITIPATSGTVTVTTNRKSSSFAHTITLKVGSTTISTKTGVGDSTTFNIADIDDAICATIPSANSATVTVSCETFNGSTSIGTNTTSFTANVGSLANPSFSNFTYSDTNSTITAITGNNQVLVSGKSTLTAVISTANKATGNYSASISQYSFAINGSTQTQAYSSSEISKSLGTVTLGTNETSNTTKSLVITATDSRGKTKGVSKDITVIPYKAPVVNATATRANGFDANTTLTISGSASPILVDGTGKNSVNSSTGVYYRYKASTSSTWGSWVAVTASYNTTTGAITTSGISNPINLDNQTAYNFEVKITDKLETTTYAFTVPVGQPAMFVGTDGRVGIGGMPSIAKTHSSHAGQLQVEGQVVRNSAGTWIYGRRNATVCNNNTATDTVFAPVCSAKSNTGAWQIGTLKSDTSNRLYFVYGSDTNYSAGTNNTDNFWIQPDGKSNIALLAYPVGSIFMSATLSTASAVATALGGGTWVAWGSGRVPVGMGSNGTTTYSTVEATGGEEKHTLSVSEMPSHTHTQNAHSHTTYNRWNTFGAGSCSGYTSPANGSNQDGWQQDYTGSTTATNQNTGGGGSHNNMQPYITCYMWKRTA